MLSGGLAPGAMFAVWLGTLLRLSQAALYTNDWAVRIPADAEAAERIAQKHGFANLGQVGHAPVRYRRRSATIAWKRWRNWSC